MNIVFQFNTSEFNLNEFAPKFIGLWFQTEVYTSYANLGDVLDDFAAYCAMSI